MASKKSKSETSLTSQPATKQKAAVAPKSSVKAEAAPTKQPAKVAPVKAVAAKAAEPAISTEAIARRAYYLAEERLQSRTPGNPTQDWLNAEKQLKAEAKPKKAGSKSSK